MIAFDSAVLTLLLNEEADSPQDPTTGKPVEKTKERIELLVQEIHKKRQRILIPTPVLAEVLVETGPTGVAYIETLQRSAVFRIEPFGTLAAIELADITRAAVMSDVGKKSGVDAPWQKIKIDRQIVAIAKVAGATAVYTNDEKLGKFAEAAGLEVVGVHELPLPPAVNESPQTELFAFLAAEGPKADEPTSSEIEAAEEETRADPGFDDELSAAGEVQGDSPPVGVQSEQSGARGDAEETRSDEAATAAGEASASDSENPEDELKPD